ncbi:PRC-barrel domain-containing protein [Streptomyces lancefieldiae]|uniref:PRC-barrel domain-containing protein n=1 Tax=Streptomyces lancefieldiae TaxID=3075520 RepID=A0ABU3APW6_9ACTN|nr:PRC-barrel domain-containing protein [Streptomyces sp. DSM 40712]MDT0611885.1 PRC-barrel domain-containing protein [Streptomyces sp. DSM 40712]
MMLFTEVRGLPVVLPAEAHPLGTVTSLTVDPASGVVSHLRLRGRRWGRETVLAWDAVHAIGPASVRVRTATAPDTVPPRHDLLGRRVLTDAGAEHGTVLDVAFAPETGRVLAVLTTRGEVSADRVLGLGDYALVVRAG